MSVVLGSVVDMTNSQINPMKATCPEDLLAFVPVAIGFLPQRSVVMLCLEGARCFHARVNLPQDESELDDMVGALMRPACKHAITKVVFLIYDDDTSVADDVAWSLHEEFTEAGIEVFELLRVHAGRYFAVLPGQRSEAYRGIPFDIEHHRFAVESVVAGRVTHASREALEDTLRSDRAGSKAVSALLSGTVPLELGGVRAFIAAHASSPQPAPPAAVAALALSMTDAELREQACCWLTREDAHDYIELWSDVVRRSPEELLPGPASVLALVCWLAGDGARAWCAVDRAQAVQPDHPLAGVVAQMLTSATPPDAWKSWAA